MVPRGLRASVGCLAVTITITITESELFDKSQGSRGIASINAHIKRKRLQRVWLMQNRVMRMHVDVVGQHIHEQLMRNPTS